MENLILKLGFLASKMSARDVSVLASVPEGRLSLIVRGKTTATADERTKIAKAAGYEVADLFGSDPAAVFDRLRARGLEQRAREELTETVIEHIHATSPAGGRG